MIVQAALLVLLPVLSVQTAVADDVDLETLLRIEGQVGEILPEAIDKTVAIRVRVLGRVGFGSGAHIGNGYILTCAHVVETASPESLTVILSDGTEHPAERLGMNPVNDYALIRIAKSDFPAFRFGDSTALRVGDWVGALGHPGGPYPDHQPAFSLGQVTGLGKQLPLFLFQKQYTEAIQTNAQIFAGNSGGPLFDLDGRLLGINGAILLFGENAYAVPIHQIAPHLEELKAGRDVEGDRIEDPRKAVRELEGELRGEDAEKIIPPWLRKFVERHFGEGEAPPEEPGQGPSDGLRRMLEEFFRGTPRPPRPLGNRARLGIAVQVPGGVGEIEVITVEEGGASERAGVRPGDKLLAIDGEEVSSLDDLYRALSVHEPGDRVEVKLSRGGWVKEVEVTLQGAGRSGGEER